MALVLALAQTLPAIAGAFSTLRLIASAQLGLTVISALRRALSLVKLRRWGRALPVVVVVHLAARTGT